MFDKKPRKYFLNNAILFLGILFVSSCSEHANKSVVADKKKPDLKKDELKAAPQKKTAFDILTFLVEEESKDEKQKKINYKNHSVSFTNEEDPYEVSFSQIATEDFNHDGLADYLIERNSEGMLGGNANSNSDIIYIVMGPGNQIAQRHEILTYAPFSYNILDEIAYKKGKLKVKSTQNFRTYTPEDGEELKSTDLSFVYKDGNVYEESYLTDCELAKWKNKHLFTGNSEVTRTIEMHNYTESVIEKYKSGEFSVSAEFSGCDNLNLLFESTFPFTSKKKKDVAEKRNQFLEFLRRHTTTLSNELELIQNYYRENESMEEKGVELGNLFFNFYTSREKGKITFRLRIEQIKNPNQSENWEITTRAK